MVSFSFGWGQEVMSCGRGQDPTDSNAFCYRELNGRIKSIPSFFPDAQNFAQLAWSLGKFLQVCKLTSCLLGLRIGSSCLVVSIGMKLFSLLHGRIQTADPCLQVQGPILLTQPGFQTI